MEQRFKMDSLQVQREFEISIDSCSPQYSDVHGLWPSTSECSNLLLDEVYNNCAIDLSLFDSSDKNFMYNSPECQFISLEPLCSEIQSPHNDVVPSLHTENTPHQMEPSLHRNQSNTVIASGVFRSDERNGIFVEWKGRPHLPSVPPHNKSQSLHKRCIRLLNCINDHKISPFHNDNAGRQVINYNYDKLAIHHVVAERKRREEMKEIFSALRQLLPLNPKKGRAAVLLHTIDYVNHLKQRVEQLEKRNEELEALHGQDAS